MTTETTPNAEKIAAGLTEAQRAAVLLWNLTDAGLGAQIESFINRSPERTGFFPPSRIRSQRKRQARLARQVREILRRQS